MTINSPWNWDIVQFFMIEEDIYIYIYMYKSCMDCWPMLSCGSGLDATRGGNNQRFSTWICYCYLASHWQPLLGEYSQSLSLSSGGFGLYLFQKKKKGNHSFHEKDASGSL